MRLRLDTHVFLWFISGDTRLHASWRDSIRNTGNEVYLSVVSLWEAIIKYHLGKLPLPHSPENYLPTQRERHQIATLPSVHRDPFDRMLVGQAIEHELTIVTVDNVFRAYPVQILSRA